MPRFFCFSACGSTTAFGCAAAVASWGCPMNSHCVGSLASSHRRAEAIASVHASAACYGRPEDVGILPVVVPELKLREVERQVLLADIVVRADDPALEQCPEAIQVRGMDVAPHVFAPCVTDGLMWIAKWAERPITDPFVCGDELHLVGDGLAHEGGQG